jgi:serine phosphatase RsbU (regulator of sigma subunit)/CheY-like chemotaxis protein
MRRKKVLIADDSPTVIKMLSFMLSSLPCEVITAMDGVEAIKLSYGAHPDLILLDILMPKMNGYQVCRLLKDDHETKHIPIVMLTAKDQQSDRFWGLATGADEYIIKDVDDDRLLEIITNLLQQETPHANLSSDGKAREITTVDVLFHANNLLDRQLYQSTITNKINQLASSIQNFDETMMSVFELLSRIITYQIGVIAVLGTQATRLRLYFYLTGVVSAPMFEQAKQLALQEFSGIALRNIETRIVYGNLSAEFDRELLSICESQLIGRTKKIGTIVLGDSRKGKFSEDEREILRISSAEVAVVIDNARLYDLNARIHEDLERELRIAYDIQKSMLPQDNPLEAVLNIEATSIPAQEVGGDYYDYFPLNDHQLLFAIGDVTGKGVPAALMMATIKTALQLRIEFTHDVREIMASLNTLVYNQTSKQSMTLFLGVIDVHTRTITYCNAGHHFPYVISGNRTLRHLEMSALPLGFIKDETYTSYVHTFAPTDILFFYTDGVIEAANEQRELFGYPRLENLLLTHCQDDLVTINLKILESIETFCHETPQDDDMTMLFVQCKQE